MMRQSFPFVFLILFVLGSVQAETKKKPVNPAYVAIEEDADMPRVLLIGDSISIGYTLAVRERLKGKANVLRIPANGGPTTRGLTNIDRWLGGKKWDLIHFNWGIHDLKHMEDGKRQVEPAEYEKNLRSLVARLQKTGAFLIWASITPIPDPPLKPVRTFGDEEEYNAIAARVMKELGIPVNDLHAWILPQFDKLHKPQDLHYGEEGSERLAEKVAAQIDKALIRN